MRSRVANVSVQAVEATAMELYVPWDEIKECDPQLWEKLRAEFMELRRVSGTVSKSVLSQYPGIVKKVKGIGDSIRQGLQRHGGSRRKGSQ